MGAPMADHLINGGHKLFLHSARERLGLTCEIGG